MTSSAVLKRWIGLELKRLRKESGLHQADAAARIGRSGAHVGYLEKSRNLPSPSDLEILLGLYGKPERTEFMRELVAAAKKGKDWWANLGSAVPPWFDLFLGLEAGAAELSSFDALLVRGLLQTRSYAEAVTRADGDLTDEEVQQHVELRMGRQQILDRTEDPVRLWTVLDEAVLYRTRGGSTVMREQIEHLVEMSERPRVTIQVLPLDAGAHLAQRGGTFTLMRFDMEGDPGMVYAELAHSGLYFQEPDEVALYERTLRHVHAAAATPDQSREIMTNAMKEV